MSCMHSTSADKVISSSQRDSIIIDSLQRKSLSFIKQKRYDLGIRVLDTLSNISRFTVERAIAINNRGYAYTKQNHLDSAVGSYLEAANVYSELDEPKKEAESLLNAGMAIKKIGELKSAFEFIQKAQLIFEKDDGDNSKRLSICYSALGNIMTKNGSYEEAIAYHKKAIHVTRKTDHQLGIRKGYNNLGNAYFEQGTLGSAKRSYLRFLRLAKEAKDSSQVGRAFQNLADVYLNELNLDSTVYCLNMADAYFKSDPAEKVVINTIWSRYFSKVNKLDSAFLFAQQAELLGDSFLLLPERLDAIRLLTNLTKTVNKDWHTHYADLYIDIQDSIFRKEKVAELASLNGRHIANGLKHSNENLREESNQNRMLKIVFLMLLLIVAVILLSQLRKFTQRKRLHDHYFDPVDSLTLKNGEKVRYENIRQVTTRSNHIVLHTLQGEMEISSTTLKRFYPELPMKHFGQVQKGIVLNLKYVTKVLKTKVTFEGKTINLSPNYRDEFTNRWSMHKTTGQIKE